jgi:3-hydroxyacyl-CoA dehydrogenase
MKLLELVAGPDTDPAVFQRAAGFGKNTLGKGIVVAKDSPNFVANRIGTHAVLATIHLMLEMGLTPEDVDAITGVPMGHPKTASFRTGDLVGIDTVVHVTDNCYNSLTEDEERDVFKLPDYVRTMVERKQLGNKTKGGFYRKTKGGFETLDPGTGEYRPRGGDANIKKVCKALAKESDVGARVRKLVATEGVAGEFAWKILSRSLAYSARRFGEICDDVASIDNGMKWGFGWEMGPFETWDALGVADAVARMQKDGIELPESITKMVASGATSFYKDDQVYDLAAGAYVERDSDPREVTLEIMRRGEAPVLKNGGAEAWDLGDGVLGVTFKTKANSIDADTIQMLHDAVDRAESDFRGVLLVNQGEHFCVGANLMLVVMAAQQKRWDDIRNLVKSYQNATQRMKYAQVPFVAMPFGMTLGGGLELCLGCDAVQAAAETYSGLVEVGVGLIPGGAGNLNLLWRALEGVPDGVEYDMYAYVTQVFKNIALADVATSAGMGKQKGYFRHTDGVSFDRARQLHEAKQRVIGLAESGYHPPIPRSYKLPGESGIATLQMMVNTLVDGGYATAHDATVAGKLANVLCGGVAGASRPVTEEEILELECEAFVSLCGEPKSQERMQYILMNNKPLRN